MKKNVRKSEARGLAIRDHVRRAVTEGKGLKEIAQELDLPYETVAKHSSEVTKEARKRSAKLADKFTRAVMRAADRLAEQIDHPDPAIAQRAAIHWLNIAERRSLFEAAAKMAVEHNSQEDVQYPAMQNPEARRALIMSTMRAVAAREGLEIRDAQAKEPEAIDAEIVEGDSDSDSET